MSSPLSPRPLALRSLLIPLCALLTTAIAAPIGFADSDSETKTTSVKAASAKPVLMPPETTNFVRGMVLLLLPDTIKDDDDWGHTKRIQSGLNIGFENGRLETSRRWKTVRHGVWRQVEAKLVDPEHSLQLQIHIRPASATGGPKYDVQARFSLAVHVRQQHWNMGVRLYSLSSDLRTDVTVSSQIRLESTVVASEQGRELELLPQVDTVRISVDRFSVRRISHMKGAIVREFGDSLEGLVQRAVRRKSKDLPAKINKKIQKRADRFRIPAGLTSLLGISERSLTEETGEEGRQTLGQEKSRPPLIIPVPPDDR